jgi:hypothetical protein
MKSATIDGRAGKLDIKFIGKAQLGGGILSKSDSEKPRKDLIDELITESKKCKTEKRPRNIKCVNKL